MPPKRTLDIDAGERGLAGPDHPGTDPRMGRGLSDGIQIRTTFREGEPVTWKARSATRSSAP
jgi:hypothetical protein